MMDEKMKTGDVWPFHYRGSKYHFNSKGEVWWVTYMGEKRVECLSGHHEIVEKLQQVKQSGGSFRITEEGVVITKKVDDEWEEMPDYEAYYVCRLEGEMKFENVDINPTDAKAGDIWPGFYDGARFHIGAHGRIWRREPGGLRWRAKNSPKELVSMLTEHKRLGGSFIINEYGHVIALLYKVPYPERIARQVGQMTQDQKEIIEVRRERIRMVPIYLGHFDGKLVIEEPRGLEDKWTPERTSDLIESLRAMRRE